MILNMIILHFYNCLVFELEKFQAFIRTITEFEIHIPLRNNYFKSFLNIGRQNSESRVYKLIYYF